MLLFLLQTKTPGHQKYTNQPKEIKGPGELGGIGGHWNAEALEIQKLLGKERKNGWVVLLIIWSILFFASWAPQKVASGQGKSSAIFREIQLGEILEFGQIIIYTGGGFKYVFLPQAWS